VEARNSDDLEDVVIPKPILSDEILELHRRLNLTNPGHMGKPLYLPLQLEWDTFEMYNKSLEIYKFNEFASRLIPLDRELPDVRTDYCKQLVYSEDLPVASVIMVFHNEAPTMILRTIYSILNRSQQKLIREIILVDDCSSHGKLF
jgi:polypeptide N-acetylgalactosaminyltransferase